MPRNKSFCCTTSPTCFILLYLSVLPPQSSRATTKTDILKNSKRESGELNPRLTVVCGSEPWVRWASDQEDRFWNRFGGLGYFWRHLRAHIGQVCVCSHSAQLAASPDTDSIALDGVAGEYDYCGNGLACSRGSYSHFQLPRRTERRFLFCPACYSSADHAVVLRSLELQIWEHDGGPSVLASWLDRCNRRVYLDWWNLWFSDSDH